MGCPDDPRDDYGAEADPHEEPHEGCVECKRQHDDGNDEEDEWRVSQALISCPFSGFG
jgi:hypothetical protein